MSVAEVAIRPAEVRINCLKCGEELPISDETRRDLSHPDCEEIWLLCPGCSYYTITRGGKPEAKRPARTNAMWGETWY